MKGDRILTPYNQVTAAGLALLRSCADTYGPAPKRGGGILLGGSSRGSHGGGGGGVLEDAYEGHEVLPGGMVCLLTNCRVMMIKVEGFEALEMDPPETTQVWKRGGEAGRREGRGGREERGEEEGGRGEGGREGGGKGVKEGVWHCCQAMHIPP
jgi:hypothetical protein